MRRLGGIRGDCEGLVRRLGGALEETVRDP